ncbi:MAG: hypothetical protein HKP59_06600 [Lutibacter sp.]|uniref:hypothetical protein n=1 Tax=Lutibacter sp. TaxID=1925666 RepID=UPI00183257C1|nr:hypothetical protein [Lutibacter sp.]MBT8317277.1 hypothetical protein [Lutibacter sp.]NNJ58136.1 hypothetical protein [Lutibacter sp.]
MIKKIIVVILTLFVSTTIFAQTNNTSAYSFFGIGDKNNINTVEQLSMGGIGVALNDVYHLNLTNPASVASLSFTTYTLAIENRNISAKDNSDQQSAAATYLSYLAFGVPIGENGGLTFGLLPNSSVGYSLVSNVLNSDSEIIDATLYAGEGGTNRVFMNFGYKLFKGVSVGLQGNYIFGKIENSIINQTGDASLATKYETISNVKGFSLNLGFQYETKINSKLDLNLGATFDLDNTIETNGNEYLYSVALSSFESPRDTILNTNSVGELKSPLKTTLGAGIGEKNKWFAAVDYSFQNALELEGSVFNSYSKISYDKYSKIAVGGFYTPKYNSISSYWDRVTYRAGFKFEKTGLLIDGVGNGTDFTAVDDFGISFGVGLPLSQQLSNLNLGFELGKRGKTNNNLVQENYFNFRLSFSLNDRWFKKLEIF